MQSKPRRKLPSPRKAAAGVSKKRTSPRKGTQQGQQTSAQQDRHKAASPEEAAYSAQDIIDCDRPAEIGTSDAQHSQLASPAPITRLQLAERSAAGPPSTSGPEPPVLPADAQQQASAQAQRQVQGASYASSERGCHHSHRTPQSKVEQLVNILGCIDAGPSESMGFCC